MKFDHIGQGVFDLQSIQHHVDLTMFEQILGRLEIGWKFLTYGLLDDAPSGETDSGTTFGNNDIAQHGETGRDTTEGGLG